MDFDQEKIVKIHFMHTKDHVLLKQMLGWPEPIYFLQPIV